MGPRMWPGLLLSLLAVACSQDESVRSVEVLRVALLPDQNDSLLRDRYQPLLEHIESSTGLPYTLEIPDSYDQLLQWFDDKRIDMALFGGVTYVMAHLNSGAMPLVMRDVDGRFRSVGLVRADNPARSLRELEGASLAFGSRLSTSGHVMPRYFLQQQGINPEAFFAEVQYSDAHDGTAERVRDGKVTLGIANSGVVHEMFRDGRLAPDNVRILWESPAFSDDVWALQPDISRQQRASIRDSFLHMNQRVEERLLLDSLGANYYIPAGHDDFVKLEETILRLREQEALQ